MRAIFPFSRCIVFFSFTSLLFTLQLQAIFPQDEVEEIVPQRRIALTIAGSDSSGGAGIQADLKTFSALRCYGMSVVTALTAQNTQGVQKIHSIPGSFVASQLTSVFDDINVSATKIGMLGTQEVIKSVGEFLKNFKIKNLVIDPVMFSKTGYPLLQEEAIDALREILPLATILTPNVHEAAKLLGIPSIMSEDGMLEAARALLDFGPQAVIVKGGACSPGNDCLVIKGEDQPIWLRSKAVVTRHLHGTGCSFSAALTSFLAHGSSLVEAANTAKRYITRAIEEGALYQLGKGIGPVHHFYLAWSPHRFTQKLWLENMPLFLRIKGHPFITQMSNNSLEEKVFHFYIQQDSMFLSERAKAYSVLASRAPNELLQSYLNKKSEKSQVASQTIFTTYGVPCSSPVSMTPACKEYTKDLLDLAYKGNFCEAFVAHLPCAIVYQKIGEYLQKTGHQPNRFQVWIAAYSSPERRKTIEDLIDMADSLEETASYEEQRAMARVFSLMAEYELKFWEDAFRKRDDSN